MIEPLNESKGNIYDQALTIEFISLCLVDFTNRPILIYQNKCYEELFMKKIFQIFPKFGMFDKKPILKLNVLGFNLK